MNFCWVTLPVNNLETSLSFYHGILGLPINSNFSEHGMEMVMLGEANQPKIELICSQDNQEYTKHSDITVGIAVDSMETTIEFLKNNQISIIRGPVSPAPNTCFLFINDPDGYEVQLVEMKK
ncbi:MAG: glyoxalase/bleomycin resistance protein/dioxygenase [Herbinix sp.]|jgi:lactoylglutathione lyase|nr:glyoxalase/bleomycin resistance protein/dioxygenase [Herbinix sp.]MDF2870038.1 glyoxalase/bleomycin resistance protein/dioxygenase [Anaerocolumna sp.]